MVWVKFAVCIIIIIIAGTKTTRYADIISQKTGLGRIWIGMLLLGIVTSMPELITGVSSITIVGDAGVPDLGVGTLLGSCIFNLSIIAIIDILNKHTPVLNQASLRHLNSAGIGILIFIVIALTSGFRDTIGTWSFGWVGIPGIVILLIYLIGAWKTQNSERNYQQSSAEEDIKNSNKTESIKEEVLIEDIKWLWPKFILGALGIIGAGIWLSFVGDEIATSTGWDTSFVGSLLLAISTSMPELIVAISAFRMGAVDLAVADILGANMLDITYIFLLDVIYSRGLIMSSVSTTHTITAIIGIIMTVIVILGIRFKTKKKTFYFSSWYGILLIGLYIFGAYALFAGLSF